MDDTGSHGLRNCKGSSPVTAKSQYQRSFVQDPNALCYMDELNDTLAVSMRSVSSPQA